VKPIRTDFTGYEGKYVATDTRTGRVVIADEDRTRFDDRFGVVMA
jgi:hypothetical protein